MSFDALGLAPELLSAVAAEGYTEPTPVQRESIPLVLDGRDLLAAAQTGTGKTAAFVLPMLQRLHETRRASAPTPAPAERIARGARLSPQQLARQHVRALVVVPTRELALQVEESIRVYGANRPVRSLTIYGGVGFDAQLRGLRNGAEVIVATPGRLLDHVGQGNLDLGRVEILVLDEADRMLDMGFIHDVRRILALLPDLRQNLLFSATFSDEIRRLADGFLVNPATVEVAPRNTTTELVNQRVVEVDKERKRELLSRLIRHGEINQALVFTRTKHGANRLAEQLVKDGIAAAAIHGNKSQQQRVKALTDFKRGSVNILVATDIAARGLDIDALPHVVNYELPNVPEDYVHRIGRTGRAGMDGEAISLVCGEEAKLLVQIEGLTGRMIPLESVSGFAPRQPLAAEMDACRPKPRGLARSGSGASAPRAARPSQPGRSSSQPGRSSSQPRRPQRQQRPAEPMVFDGVARAQRPGESSAPRNGRGPVSRDGGSGAPRRDGHRGFPGSTPAQASRAGRRFESVSATGRGERSARPDAGAQRDFVVMPGERLAAASRGRSEADRG